MSGARHFDTLILLINVMRCLVAPGTSLALGLAFILAPFQHVHPEDSHDHSAIIHAHFHSDSPGVRHHSGLPELTTEEEQTEWSVDTFTLVLPVGFAPFIPSRAPTPIFAPPETVAHIEAVDECGHDPPCAGSLIPRAPPA
jgi:hypothetical protein